MLTFLDRGLFFIQRDRNIFIEREREREKREIYREEEKRERERERVAKLFEIKRKQE